MISNRGSGWDPKVFVFLTVIDPIRITYISKDVVDVD